MINLLSKYKWSMLNIICSIVIIFYTVDLRISTGSAGLLALIAPFSLLLTAMSASTIIEGIKKESRKRLS